VVLSAAASVALSPPIEELVAHYLGPFLRTGHHDLRGQWRSIYDYLSDDETQVNEQLMKLTQIGRRIYGKNIGGPSSHRHLVRLRVDGEWVTGTWRNIAKGATHYGVLQLRLRPSGNNMTGRWLGFDADAEIQAGNWKWERIA